MNMEHLFILLTIATLHQLSYVAAETYHVVPTSSTPCPEGGVACFTLSQYSTKPVDYFNTFNTTLVLLPGNHTLDSELTFRNIAYLTIRSQTALDLNYTTSIFTCGKPGKFNLDSNTHVSISDLSFSAGCVSDSSTDPRPASSNHIRRSVDSFGKGGALFISYCGDVALSNCALFGFETFSGGALYLLNSSLKIENCNITNSSSFDPGGAVFSTGSNLTIVGSHFLGNVVGDRYGGAVCAVSSNVTIQDSSFMNNSAQFGFGGALFLYKSRVSIQSSSFLNNSEGFYCGGAVVARHSHLNVEGCTFDRNQAAGSGGAMCIEKSSTVEISGGTFTDNTAFVRGGAVEAKMASFVALTDSRFSNNSAGFGGALSSWQHDSFYWISGCSFTGNRADVGGVTYAVGGTNIVTYNSSYIDNTVVSGGAVFSLFSASLVSTDGFRAHGNTAPKYGILQAVNSTLSFAGLTNFYSNHGTSLHAIASNANFSGNTTFDSNSHRYDRTSPVYNVLAGGAVTGFQSSIIFGGVVQFLHNSAEDGGAILMTESKLYMQGHITLAYNTAKMSGGGIFAYQSELYFMGRVLVVNNTANATGGGMHVVSTTVSLTEGVLYFESNTAERGGGVCLQLNAKLYIIKSHKECINNRTGCTNTHPIDWLKLQFTNNSADYGGAVYVSDETNSGTCSVSTVTFRECFIQVLALYDDYQLPNINLYNAFFYRNVAHRTGKDIYGGLLDRCSINPFSEVFTAYSSLNPSNFDGISHISTITPIRLRDIKSVVASQPVRVCFCREYNEPDCNYQPPTVLVRKGGRFSLSLVAVDQVNNTVPSTTIHSAVSPEAGLSTGQAAQLTNNDTVECSELEFNVLSPNNFETLTLFAEGPCKDLGISASHVDIHFVPCPLGFEELDSECRCDHSLAPYVTNCSVSRESVLREGEFWISYSNQTTTDHGGIVIYPHCPFDYCRPPSEQIWVNLSEDNGSDMECDFNRTGKLCGSCEDGLSLSLGSSRCIPCSNNWLALLIVFAIAGVALVAFLLVCNLTVAVGTINGLIFYANVVIANRAIFFPSNQPNRLSVFIAWLNLDFGFETCFFRGMDGYTKVWLQLVFPTYIFILVAMVILTSEYSRKFARLISNRNPVATLATLILLSYTKLLRMIIDAVSFARLCYPDGSCETLWLVDANVPYLRGKHIPLFLTALLILIVGFTYTFLLFSWQWLLLCPNIRPLKWIRNTKLYSFMDAYHAPYNAKHRYWTGLLLLVRALLYIVSALNVLDNPSVNLLSIACLMAGLLLLNNLAGRIYKNWFLNTLDISFIFNLIIFAAATYHVRETGGNQAALAHTSMSVAFITFIGTLLFHLYIYILRKPFQHLRKMVSPRILSTHWNNHTLLHASLEDNTLTDFQNSMDGVCNEVEREAVGCTSTEISLIPVTVNGNAQFELEEVSTVGSSSPEHATVNTKHGVSVSTPTVSREHVNVSTEVVSGYIIESKSTINTNHSA